MNENHDARKEAKEDFSIGLYFKFRPELARTGNLQKKCRPDYIIGDNVIGIEITELTLQSEQVIQTVAIEFHHTNLPIEEIQPKMIREHGKKANDIDVNQYGSLTAFSSDYPSFLDCKDTFAELIIKKYKKYKEMIPDFQSFVILCNAIYTGGITSEKEAKELVRYVDSQLGGQYDKGFDIAILFSGEDNNYHLYEARLSNR